MGSIFQVLFKCDPQTRRLNGNHETHDRLISCTSARRHARTNAGAHVGTRPHAPAHLPPTCPCARAPARSPFTCAVPAVRKPPSCPRRDHWRIHAGRFAWGVGESFGRSSPCFRNGSSSLGSPAAHTQTRIASFKRLISALSTGRLAAGFNYEYRSIGSLGGSESSRCRHTKMFMYTADFKRSLVLSDFNSNDTLPSQDMPFSSTKLIEDFASGRSSAGEAKKSPPLEGRTEGCMPGPGPGGARAGPGVRPTALPLHPSAPFSTLQHPSAPFLSVLAVLSAFLRFCTFCLARLPRCAWVGGNRPLPPA